MSEGETAAATGGAAKSAGQRPAIRAYAAVSTSVLMWGYSAVVIKGVPASALVVTFYRLWFAIPIVWLVVLAVPSLRQRLGWQWLIGSLAGGVLFGLHQILFVSAMKLTSVANVSVIAALQPVLVLLVAGPLFGEFRRRGALGWALVALAGTVLFLLGSDSEAAASPAGDALAFANLLAFTAYFLVSRRVRANVGAWEYVIGMTTVAGLVVLPLVLLAAPGLGAVPGWQLLLLMTLAIFPGTLGHVLTNWAHAHVTAFSISMIFLAAPVVTSTAAWIVLGEALSLSQMLGGAVVMTAIASIVARQEEKTRAELAETVAETDAP